MAKYPVNKGIGRSPEFKGLKSQYLFIFAGGLLALFVVFVIMYMAGIGQWVCIGFGVISALVLVWATFSMNTKYGEWGLMKLHALRSHPRYIISRRKFLRLFSCKHSINSPFHSKKCDITFVIKVKKLNCYVTSMDHGRF